MYKPLYLSASKSGSEFEHRSLFKTESPERRVTKKLARLKESVARLEPATAKMKAAHAKVHVLYPKTDHITRQPNPVRVDSKALSPAPDLSDTIEKPRSIKSYRSDRVAIYDELSDTFHAYSVTEAISQPGLSFQEAVDWVDDRLVLVGKGMNSKNMTVAVSLMLASSAIAILLIASLIRFIF